MIEIPVDFNNVGADGFLRASARRLTTVPSIGDEVVVFDQEEDMAYRARVTSSDAKRIVLNVDWDSAAALAARGGFTVLNASAYFLKAEAPVYVDHRNKVLEGGPEVSAKRPALAVG